MLRQKSGFSNHRSFFSIPKALTDPWICRQRSSTLGDYSSSPPRPTKTRIASKWDPGIWGFSPPRLPRSHLPSRENTLSWKLDPVTQAGNRKKKHNIDPRVGRDLGRQRLTTLRSRVASWHVKDRTGGDPRSGPRCCPAPSVPQGCREAKEEVGLAEAGASLWAWPLPMADKTRGEVTRHPPATLSPFMREAQKPKPCTHPPPRRGCGKGGEGGQTPHGRPSPTACPEARDPRPPLRDPSEAYGQTPPPPPPPPRPGQAATGPGAPPQPAYPPQPTSVARVPTRGAPLTLFPPRAAHLCAGMRCEPRPFPTRKCTSLSTSLLKRKAKRSCTVGFVACQL